MSLFKQPSDKKVEIALDLILTVIGIAIFSLGLHVFIAPNQIAPGGVSGISIVVNYITNVDIGMINFIINIPLFILGLWQLGKAFMLKTAVALVGFTVFTDYVFAKVPVYTGNKLLAVIFGGAVMGIGLGIILSRESSSGGMDIINKITVKKFPFFKMGAVMFCTDLVIIGVSGLVFESLESALYAIIAMFITAMVIDKVLYGLDAGKMLMIVSDKAEEISAEIMKKIDRGATLVDGKGAYTGQNRTFIICAVSQSQYVKVKRIVHDIDKNAFVIITNSNEIVGEGFKRHGT